MPQHQSRREKVYSPGHLAVAVVAGATLGTSGAVLTGRLLAPVDNLFAPAASPAGRAVAAVVAVAVNAGSAVNARPLVAG